MNKLITEFFYNSIRLRNKSSIEKIEVRHKIISGVSAGKVITCLNNGDLGFNSISVFKDIWSNWLEVNGNIVTNDVTIENEYPNNMILVSEVRYASRTAVVSSNRGIFATIAVIARVYLFGYNLVNPSDGAGSVIGDIARSFPQLLKSINEIQQNLEEIKRIIDNLEIKIKGVFREEMARNAYEDSKDMLAELTPLLSNEISLRVNADVIFSKTLDIAVMINKYLRNTPSKGDISSMAIAAPLISLYSKVYTYSQRQKVINSGGDPSLASNAFDSPLTQKLSLFLNETYSEFKFLEAKYNRLLHIEFQSSFTDTYRFNPKTKEFSKTNILPWAGIFWETGCGPFPDMDWKCFGEQLNAHKDKKYNNLFMIANVGQEIKLFGTMWYEYEFDNIKYEGYNFIGITSTSGHYSDYKIAYDYFNDWLNARIFFEEKDGLFFREINKFEKLRTMINSRNWDMENDIVLKYKAICPEHSFESVEVTTSEAEVKLNEHLKMTSGKHSGSGIIEVWE